MDSVFWGYLMKVQYKGRQVEAQRVEFLTRREGWNEYQLTDGTILRMKTVVSEVIKVLDETNAEGNQIYQVRSTNLVWVCSS